ncbi:hypothetical protein VF14_35210 [Nostoc linckia z18]|uniref:Uncharacterized protein n=2 Tax=Nostoc linckia TaxID=92942 RepID=A0A9Q6EHK6_NOSLI|nr:hypothetical protein [Nostoc linckia]PHK28922.1 hypothetical protein VF12_31915 [Nostoc linckia z15]PHK38845.1 hypothetical protein VF13_35370 [Nostoc linckia z16]PHJ54495.1 hypothetical protein VF02_36685 [Nostoc linckia z1]PHJ57580.1 hypothetical protein VF05_35465 [Nostoc linckia z3]PHJ58995.1 hypothetical protein VF03_34970 [Nostoc linckia z2]
MPLPEGFDEWENLQEIVRLEHNKAVRAYFKNQPDDDVSNPKPRLKHSCLMKDNDTSTMTLMRMWLFEITCGHAQALQRPVYGIPWYEVQSERTFKPQIKLYFLEPYNFNVHDENTPQLEGEITFRLMDETSETISRAKAETLARNIKSVFATPLFTWNKGKFKCTYFDTARGYELKLLVTNKAEGERIIRAVLDIQNHPFDREYIQFIDNDRTYPSTPSTHRVYGHTVKKFVRRRMGDLKFRYAQLLIWGKQNPVNLVATSGTRLKSVIERV